MNLETIQSSQSLVVTSEGQKDQAAEERNNQLLAIVQQLEKDNAALNERLSLIKQGNVVLAKQQRADEQVLQVQIDGQEAAHQTNLATIEATKKLKPAKQAELESRYQQEYAANAPARALPGELQSLREQLRRKNTAIVAQQNTNRMLAQMQQAHQDMMRRAHGPGHGF